MLNLADVDLENIWIFCSCVCFNLQHNLLKNLFASLPHFFESLIPICREFFTAAVHSKPSRTSKIEIFAESH